MIIRHDTDWQGNGLSPRTAMWHPREIWQTSSQNAQATYGCLEEAAASLAAVAMPALAALLNEQECWLHKLQHALIWSGGTMHDVSMLTPA